jgi:hypothetical protein
MALKKVLTLLVLLSSPVFCARFEVQDLTQRNLFAIVSEAPLEKIVAQCSLFRGFLEVDPLKLESGIQGEIELDLRSCHSGSGLRDMILQEQLLDNKQYPLVLIKLKKWGQEVKGVLSQEEVPAIVLADGEVNYRGKTSQLSVPLKLRFFKESDKSRQRLPGNLVRISSQVEVELGRFGISVPEKLKPIFSKRIEVLFDAVGSDKLPNDKIIFPEGPKPKERS